MDRTDFDVGSFEAYTDTVDNDFPLYFIGKAYI